jgi:hypothetical protein
LLHKSGPYIHMYVQYRPFESNEQNTFQMIQTDQMDNICSIWNKTIEMVPTVQMDTIFFHLTKHCQMVKWSHAALCQRKACPMDQMDQIDKHLSNGH